MTYIYGQIKALIKQTTKELKKSSKHLFKVNGRYQKLEFISLCFKTLVFIFPATFKWKEGEAITKSHH